MRSGAAAVGAAVGTAVLVWAATVLAAPGTIYVNFDGPALTQGQADDAAANVTAIAELSLQTEAFGGDAAQRQAVLESVRADFAPFDVRVVEQRPTSGAYVMAVVTPTNPFGMGVSGAAINDCGDAAGRSDVVFAFFGAGTGPALDIATTISQEVAHSIGLEHVDDAADVLYPIANGVDAYFNDTCLDLSSGSACADQHATFCEDADTQNSFAELLAAFGSAEDDSSPPSVDLVGFEQNVVAGDDVDFTVDAYDDVFVDRVVLYEGGQPVGEDRAPPYLFTVVGIEEGEYEIYAVAIDAAGNEAMSEVIDVTAASGGIPSGSGATGLPPVSRGTDDEGCACRATGGRTPPPVALGLALGLALLVGIGRRGKAAAQVPSSASIGESA